MNQYRKGSKKKKKGGGKSKKTFTWYLVAMPIFLENRFINGSPKSFKTLSPTDYLTHWWDLD